MTEEELQTALVMLGFKKFSLMASTYRIWTYTYKDIDIHKIVGTTSIIYRIDNKPKYATDESPQKIFDILLEMLND